MATGVAATGVDDGVDLYRHVSPGELADIGQHGFRPGPNSLGGKWFAESGEHASEWGRVLNNGEGSVLKVRVPGSFADQLMRLREARRNRTSALRRAAPTRHAQPIRVGAAMTAWTGLVRFRSAAEGGRQSGPPPGPTYMATAVPDLGGEAEVLPGWPATGPQFSVVLELLGSSNEDGWAAASIRALVEGAPGLGGALLWRRTCRARRAAGGCPHVDRL